MSKEMMWPASTVVSRKTADLIPYARNTRTHSDEQIAQIAGSIREWGFTTAVLIDEEMNIIAGHGRVLAAQRLGLEFVPTMMAFGWTPAQKKAYAIADNQLALVAGWNEELLSGELHDLNGIGFHLEKIGFPAGELERLMFTLAAPEDFEAVDENLETEHQCPSCGFKWSGTGKAKNKDNPND